MNVAVIQVELRLHGPNSLKDKRRIILPLKNRLKRHFEVSVAEIGDQDAWRTSTLGMALVSLDPRHARSRADRILDDLENQADLELIDSQVEIL